MFIALLLVLALGCVGFYGAQGNQFLFGVVIPYAAVIVFIAGFVSRIMAWAKTPVPYSIPTTAGQQWSLDWVKRSPLDNPSTPVETVGRMLLEVLAFRSLFRNTKVTFHPAGEQMDIDGRVGYSSSKWLWLFAILFHYSFLTVFIRHFRFFLEPVPVCIQIVEFLDGIMQIGVPRLFQSGVILAVAAALLLMRRIFDNKVRYISLLNDYFPLFLILGISLTGIWMRYFTKTDIASVKALTMSLVTLNPAIPEGVAPIFFLHIFLVSVLLIYFPFSKLMHMGGVFLSPTRNMPNNTRFVRHRNPWNPPAKFHTYAAYEDDFRDAMVEAGVRVDKMPADAEAEE
ncbi:MAG: sulfate reduction electron transfer complex DsrMKJOP subunit DsrM [Desulfovibrionaceae bacterium]